MSICGMADNLDIVPSWTLCSLIPDNGFQVFSQCNPFRDDINGM